MGKNRPIVVATLGYIIGIIWGLYLNISIVFFYVIIYIFLMIGNKIKKQKTRKFKIISIKRIFRYIKLILDFRSIIIIVVFSSVSNFIVLNLNKKYEEFYSMPKGVEIIGRIVDNGTYKEYKTTYKIKIEKLNKVTTYKSTYLYLDISSKIKTNLKYGDYIYVQGEYEKPGESTNYKGFDYSKYLKLLKIYGTIKVNKVNIIKENSNNIFFTISNNILTNIRDIIRINLPEEKANLLLGILVGYKSEMSEEIQENFIESKISHILAVSGLHVSYIILAITKMSKKLENKKCEKIITIFFIIAYMFITNFSPSVVRAGLMGIISICGSLTYNKNDIWTSIAISLLVILIYNPFLITSVGVLLSYSGTIGIIVFNKSILGIFNNVKAKSKIYKYNNIKINVKIINYIQDTIAVTFSAQLAIEPIMCRIFNTISLTFFITNFLVSIIIGPIIILGFLFVISNFLFSQFLNELFISNFINISIKFILENLLNLLINISKIGKQLPFNKIYVATPEIWEIIIYYIAIYIFNIFIKISLKKKRSNYEQRIINFKNLIKHLIRKNYRKVAVSIIGVVIIFTLLKVMPKDLRVYFIDVNQGDATLIITPQNKTILIDGGGSENYDVGKNTLLPYLLDRGITKIDYVIISHFDTDHVGGIITLMEEIKIKRVIIGRQYENSENFEEFLKLIKDNNIFVKKVSIGDKINIEKNLQIDILFPEKELISINAINNNSLVFKLVYKKFSIIFTGDIEEIAEEKLIKIYKETNILKSNILKVAHHGSKTSSTEMFLKLVQPQIALIGVGKNNLYKHPNEEILERITKIRSENI